MIDRETQQKIKDAANIVEVVGDYVKLTRRGANYMGLCPFHNERTPSFSVSPRRNFCHCFSCKKGGSPVNFLMEKEGVSYTEALLLLAKKYNIPVEERELSDEEKARMSEREAMLVANEWAMNHFHSNLLETEEGRDIGLAYLYGRGITEEAIRKFKLGYSIDKGDELLEKARREGFDIDILKKIGLIGTSQQGREYDKFRGRVMFPIRNASGKTVAFGGRALKGEPAKYINSPESLVYKKSNELYGIYEAKSDILKQDRVFLMEGYLDVIGSWQVGFRNVVASSGTALTESQVALIHRFTDNVTLIYDGDSAGIKAAFRGIDMLLSQKLHVKVLLLPDGEDPDSFARKSTPEEFKTYLELHQTDFIKFKIEVLLRNANGNPQEVSDAVRSVVNSISCIPDEIERITYIKECAHLMGIDEKVITKQVGIAILSQKDERQPFRQNTAKSNQEPLTVQSDPQQDKKPIPEVEKSESKFIRQEREILKYCVRYGYLTINPASEESKMVIDFVEEELEADGIGFMEGSFSKIFEILKSRKTDFLKDSGRHKERIEETLQEERDKFHARLRMEGGSMARIRAEEKKFFASEADRRNSMLKNFAIDYSVNHLICHEDDDVRAIVNPLVAERHSLSSIYTKNGNTVVPEEERLQELLPRALSELRSEILNRKVEELQKKVAQAIETNDREAQQQLMSQLSKVLFIRSRIAVDLGERILSPR